MRWAPGCPFRWVIVTMKWYRWKQYEDWPLRCKIFGHRWLERKIGADFSGSASVSGKLYTCRRRECDSKHYFDDIVTESAIKSSLSRALSTW